VANAAGLYMQADFDHPVPRAPQSPCINVCVLDAAGFCVGCLRTGDEIGRWSALSAAEQWRLIAQLEERRKQRVGGGSSARVTPQGGGSNEI